MSKELLNVSQPANDVLLLHDLRLYFCENAEVLNTFFSERLLKIECYKNSKTKIKKIKQK